MEENGHALNHVNGRMRVILQLANVGPQLLDSAKLGETAISSVLDRHGVAAMSHMGANVQIDPYTLDQTVDSPVVCKTLRDLHGVVAMSHLSVDVQMGPSPSD